MDFYYEKGSWHDLVQEKELARLVLMDSLDWVLEQHHCKKISEAHWYSETLQEHLFLFSGSDAKVSIHK